MVAHERYETAKRRGKPKEPRTAIGVLCQIDAAKRSLRLEMWVEHKYLYAEIWGGPTGMGGRTYEDFQVAKDAAIVQDNAPTKFADLKKDCRVTVTMDADGKQAVKLTADGGTARGRYVSMNESRNTFAVLAGKKDERKVYHLLKETGVLTDKGQPARLSDFKEGTPLLLTLSVEDRNTAIRIEPLPPGGEKNE